MLADNRLEQFRGCLVRFMDMPVFDSDCLDVEIEPPPLLHPKRLMVSTYGDFRDHYNRWEERYAARRRD